MWIIWIYFFLSSSGALGHEFCDYLNGFKDEPVEQPTHAFRSFPYIKTYKVSRNNSVELPCVLQNSDGNGKVWKKGENIICDADNFVCKNSTVSNTNEVKYLLLDGIKCGPHQPGWNMHLHIGDVQHKDAGEYFCEVKSPPSQVLTKITLKVVDTEFITKEQTFTVNEGDTVTLPCEVKDIGDDYVPWWIYDYYFTEKYLFDGEILKPGLKLEGYNLQIQNITQKQAGYYSCVLDTWPPKDLTHEVIVKKNQTLRS